MDNDHAARILKAQITLGGDLLINTALDRAIMVLENSTAPQCVECHGFPVEKLNDVDGSKICDECLSVWQDEARSEAPE